jgi:DNA-binding NarL/FixJ family response regulator
VERSTDPVAATDRRPRLLIADSHQLFRECLATALREDSRFADVEVAASAGEALARLAARGPDVVLLGVERSADGALETVREVAGRLPPVRVLVLGPAATDRDVVALLEAGAGGYLFRDQSLAELCAAAVEVAEGGVVCAPRVARLLFARLAQLGRERRRRERLDFLNLTARELEILRLIADGAGNREIARKLYLSIHTVKNHVHKILETLGVEDRRGAVRHAFEKGWLEERRRRGAR